MTIETTEIKQEIEQARKALAGVTKLVTKCNTSLLIAMAKLNDLENNKDTRLPAASFNRIESWLK